MDFDFGSSFPLQSNEVIQITKPNIPRAFPMTVHIYTPRKYYSPSEKISFQIIFVHTLSKEFFEKEQFSQNMFNHSAIFNIKKDLKSSNNLFNEIIRIDKILNSSIVIKYQIPEYFESGVYYAELISKEKDFPTKISKFVVHSIPPEITGLSLLWDKDVYTCEEYAYGHLHTLDFARIAHEFQLQIEGTTSIVHGKFSETGDYYFKIQIPKSAKDHLRIIFYFKKDLGFFYDLNVIHPSSIPNIKIEIIPESITSIMGCENFFFFKALSSNFLPIEVEGELYKLNRYSEIGQRIKIMDLKSEHRGRGMFNFQFKMDEQYEAQFLYRGQVCSKVEINARDLQSFHLKKCIVGASNPFLEIEMRNKSTDNSVEEYILFISNKDETLFKTSLKLSSTLNCFKIHYSKFPFPNGGVLIVSIYKKNLPVFLSERLFFREPDYILKILPTFDFLNYFQNSEVKGLIKLQGNGPDHFKQKAMLNISISKIHPFQHPECFTRMIQFQNEIQEELPLLTYDQEIHELSYEGMNSLMDHLERERKMNLLLGVQSWRKKVFTSNSDYGVFGECTNDFEAMHRRNLLGCYTLYEPYSDSSILSMSISEEAKAQYFIFKICLINE